MVPVTHRKGLAFGQKIDNLLKLLEVISPFSQALDIPRELFGLRDLFHFSQFLKSASIESNS
jgi:hypothetical protein